MPTQTPTPNVTPGAKEFAENKKLIETLSYLWSRWQDEKEYEDINDYALPVKAIADTMAIKPTIVKMNKRPFGCVFQIDDRQFQIKVTASNYGWIRIK